MIKVEKLKIPEILILNYTLSEDNRAKSQRLFSKSELLKNGINTEFIEEIIYTIKKSGTLYGIHFQNNPKAQTKLLYCLKGRGIDFAIDLRKNSPTFKSWVCTELNSENKKQIYIPKGFGHAFLSLEDETQIVMKIDELFDLELSKAIKYNDPDLNVKFDISNPILSEMDKKALTLKDTECNL